jgi:hypothetical protein
MPRLAPNKIENSGRRYVSALRRESSLLPFYPEEGASEQIFWWRAKPTVLFKKNSLS